LTSGSIPAAFNPVAISAEPESPASAERAEAIEIEFAAGGPCGLQALLMFRRYRR